MRAKLASAAFLALLMVSSPVLGADDVSAGTQRPTPRLWDQWQPQTDSSDSRLDSTSVSVWERDITVADLLSRLSEQSFVQLSAVEDLLSVRVSIFAEDRMLSGVMWTLARLFHGYWACERERAPTDRAYVLAQHGLQPYSVDELGDLPFVQLAEAASERLRSDLQAQLPIYQTALSLSPEELLRRHEEAHPWLCANLLDPDTRPMVEAICGLDEAQREQLLARGLAVIPLNQIDAAWRQRLSDKATGSCPSRRHREKEGAEHPEYPPDYTIAILRWNGPDIGVFLRSAEGSSSTPSQVTWPWSSVEGRSSMLSRVTFLPLDPPDKPRRRLIELGYGDDDPERLAAIEEEARAWEAAMAESEHPVVEFFSTVFGPAASDDEDSDLDPFLPACDQIHPSLSTALDLSGMDGDRFALAVLLEQVARQCDLRVVAHCLPPEDCMISRPSVDIPEVTLGTLLNAVRKQQSAEDYALSWSFHGTYLVIRQTDIELIRQQGTEWWRECHPVLMNLGEDIAGAIAAAGIAMSGR
jgi:hypothetical protein